jgi:para-aminobenzoate synthetase component 1
LRVTTLEQWRAWAAEFNALPYVLCETWTGRIFSWERAWAERSPHAVLLESGKGGRYTYLGLHPESIIVCRNGEAAVRRLDGTPAAEPELRLQSALEAVRSWMRAYRAPVVPGAPRFLGGAAGFWSYDLARSIERLPQLAVDDLTMPDALFMRFHQLFVFDHESKRLYFCVIKRWEPDAGKPLDVLYEEAEREAETMRDAWRSWRLDELDAKSAARQALWSNIPDAARLRTGAEAWPDLHCDFPENDYKAAVRRIREYIRAGDVFQVNLALRQHRVLRSAPTEIYEWLRMINPSPYMGMIRMPGLEIVSGSPELLVRLERGRVSTRPIAGTRRRGFDAEEETRFLRELRENEKERAEHIMLVDLLRNDIGRIARYGSVRVSELMTVESYSHVMHLVSQVEGELAEGLDGFDVIRAVFPGGTITGAPKIRTMEIIEELEPVRRGVYTGSIGWIDYTGDMEFNIVIRTLVVKDGIGYVQAGAGIVIDSSPEREYKESLNKARALWKAIELSEREGTT